MPKGTRDAAPEQGPGPRCFKDTFRAVRSAFPDLRVTPEHMTATEEDVALAYTVTGRHEGDFLGAEPRTGEGQQKGLTDKISDALAGR